MPEWRRAGLYQRFDVAEDRHPGLGLRSKPSPCEQLAFQGCEEALAHGVIVRIADGSHGRSYAGLATTAAEGQSRVSSFTHGSAEWLYDSLYCARGQAENLIKLHKSQLASDRTSCRSPLANQVRLVLHTAAYWLMLTVRDAIAKTQPLALAEFATLRARLLKVAARITETASRVRIAFAAACPEADLFRRIARSLQPAGP